MVGYFYTSIVGVAFFISLVSFRFNYKWHLKFFSILLGITFFVEVMTILMIKVLHVKSTQWVYNLFMPVEYASYGYYYLHFLKTKWIRKLVWIFIIVYPLAGLVSTFIIFKFYNWNSYEAIAGSFFTIVLAVSCYFELLISKEEFELRDKPEFWIATGMIIFYSCLLPVVGTLNYVIKVSMNLALTFLDVLDYIDILMYLIFSYAFLCRIITKK